MKFAILEIQFANIFTKKVYFPKVLLTYQMARALTLKNVEIVT